jgi:hypothetical protein
MRYRDITGNDLMAMRAEVDATDPQTLFMLETLTGIGVVLRRIRTVDEQSEVLLTILGEANDWLIPTGIWLEVDAAFINFFVQRTVYNFDTQEQRRVGQYFSYNRGRRLCPRRSRST